MNIISPSLLYSPGGEACGRGPGWVTTGDDTSVLMVRSKGLQESVSLRRERFNTTMVINFTTIITQKWPHPPVA